MITTACPRTLSVFDNLLEGMCHVFYQLEERPTHILAANNPLVGYECLVERQNQPVTTFKGIPVLIDTTLPKDEMHFMRNGVVIGRLHSIS